MQKFLVLDNHRLKNLIIVLFSLSIIFFLQLFLKNEINSTIFFLLFFLIFVNYFSFYFYFHLKKENENFPIFPLIVFYYLLTFTGYFYFSRDLYYEESSDILSILILAISLGILFFSLGYFSLYSVVKKNKTMEFKYIDRYNPLIIGSLVVFLIFIHANIYNNYLPYGFINQLREPITLIIISMLYFSYAERKNIFILTLNIFFILVFFFIEISTGSTVFPFMIFLMLISVSYFKTKKINLFHIILLLLLVFFFHNIKHDIRSKTWSSNTVDDTIRNTSLHFKDNKPDLKKNLGATYDAMYDNLKGNKKLFDNPGYQKLRLFHSNITLQRTLDFTPEYVNYLSGESYKSIPYKIIPRFIYKNKPAEEWGNSFGKFYKVLNYNDFVTSWNYPILSEFYSNYGFKGIIFGMFILGLFIKILVLITQFFINSILISSMGYVVAFNLVFQESNLSMLVGKVVNQILFFLCVIISIIIFHYFVSKIKNEN